VGKGEDAEREREQKRVEPRKRKVAPARLGDDVQERPLSAAGKGTEGKRTPKAKFLPDSEQFPVDGETARKTQPKKYKKKIEEDKTPKVKKRLEKSVADDKMDIEEIKSEIQLEELKEKLKEKKEKAKVKEKKVAFQDEGGFGGIFASKLDEVIKKDEPEEKKKAKK
jgi:hypothetical protein